MIFRLKGSYGAPGLKLLTPFLHRGVRFKVGNASCLTVKESLPSQLHWVVRLIKAKEVFSVFQSLQMAGIGEFWGNLQKRDQFSKMMYKSMSNETRDIFRTKERPMQLIMESSPKIVFIFYLVCIGVAVFAFLSELIFVFFIRPIVFVNFIRQNFIFRL